MKRVGVSFVSIDIASQQPFLFNRQSAPKEAKAPATDRRAKQCFRWYASTKESRTWLCPRWYEFGGFLACCA